MIRPSTTICLWIVMAAQLGHSELIRLALFSDVHFDPLYGSNDAYGMCTTSTASQWGSPGCDAPLNLVTSAIQDAGAQMPDLMLMSGDWLRHGFGSLPYTTAAPTFQVVAKLLSEVMPNTSNAVFSVPNFQGALGNNDFVPDYHFNLSNPAHSLLLNQSNILESLQLLAPSEATTFGKCGYYARDVLRKSSNIPSGLRIVVLNTIMYSVLLDPALSADVQDPCGQFAFLNETLADAASLGRRVIIVAHIPPGMNLYNVLVNGPNSPISTRQFWMETFVAQYQAIVKQYASTVRFQFFGHTHMFSVMADEKIGVPGIIVPSVTQLFGNNPSYLLAELDDETWSVSEVRQRYLTVDKTTNAGTWVTSPIPVSSIFGDRVAAGMFSRGNVTEIADGAIELASNDTLWSIFQQIHEGGITLNLFPTPPSSPAPPIKGLCNADCKQIVLCSQLYTSWSDVTACLSAPMPTLAPGGGSFTPAPTDTKNNSNIAGGYIALYVMCGIIGSVSIALVGRRIQTICGRRRTVDDSFPRERSSLVVNPEPMRRENGEEIGVQV